MIRSLVVALFAVLLTAACSTQPSSKQTLISTYVTTEGAARMLAADGMREKSDTARKLCNEAGLDTGSEKFLRCYRDYQAFDLYVTRTRVRAITEEVARQHGLCIDRRRFEIARCTEI